MGTTEAVMGGRTIQGKGVGAWPGDEELKLAGGEGSQGF